MVLRHAHFLGRPVGLGLVFRDVGLRIPGRIVIHGVSVGRLDFDSGVSRIWVSGHILHTNVIRSARVQRPRILLAWLYYKISVPS